MKFNDFINKGIVKKISKDIFLAKTILKTSKKDMAFLNSIQLNEESSRKLTTNYYDCLRSIIEAIAYKEGFKVYSHEALTYFLKEINEELISIKFDRLRKIRNSINYYGEDISINETKDNIFEIKAIIDTLIKKYLNNLK